MKLETAKRLHDAVQACREIETFTAGRADEDILTDRTLQLVLQKLVEVVGESIGRALRIDPSISSAIPDVHRIVGMRNRLSHEYDSVNWILVWEVCTERIPPLRAVIERLLTEPLEDA